MGGGGGGSEQPMFSLQLIHSTNPGKIGNWSMSSYSGGGGYASTRLQGDLTLNTFLIFAFSAFSSFSHFVAFLCSCLAAN